MFFQRRTWLWLYIRTSIILGSELKSPEQHGKITCYQLNKFPCSFEEAENYCRAQRGHLASTWNQEGQDLIHGLLEQGKKWWIGQNLMPLGKNKEKHSPGKALRFGVYEGNFLPLYTEHQSLYFIPIIPLEYFHLVLQPLVCLCSKDDEIFLRAYQKLIYLIFH